MSDLKPSRKMKSVSTDELVITEGEAGAEMVVAVLVDGLGDVRASGANLTLFFDGLLAPASVIRTGTTDPIWCGPASNWTARRCGVLPAT